MSQNHDNTEPLLVCRCTYQLRALLTGILGPVLSFSVLFAVDGSTDGAITAAITAGILAWVWLGDSRKQARIFRDRIEVDTLFRKRSVMLGPTTEYRHLQQKSYLFLIQVGTNHKIAVDDGTNWVVLKRLTRLDEAMDLLREIEMKDVLPLAIVSADNGAQLSFGPLTLEGDRIRYRGEEVRVPELAEVKTRNGILELWLPDERLPWAYEGGQSVPNLATFIELMRRQIPSRVRA